MKFGIVTFPGSNCDYDAFHAVTEILGEDATYLWHKARLVDAQEGPARAFERLSAVYDDLPGQKRRSKPLVDSSTPQPRLAVDARRLTEDEPDGAAAVTAEVEEGPASELRDEAHVIGAREEPEERRVHSLDLADPR